MSSFLVAYHPKKSESENNAHAGGGGEEGAVDRGFYGGERVANSIDFLLFK